MTLTTLRYPEIRYPDDISKVPKVPDNWGLTTLKKLKYEYIFFFKIEGIHESNCSRNCDMLRIYLFGQNPYESIFGLDSEYISFFAIEYEYN